MKNAVILIIIFSFYSSHIFSQLTINVNSVPNNTSKNDSIYIVGNFNNWNPNDSNYKLVNKGDGTYKITFTPTIETLEYKFTKGSWALVESDFKGHDIGNRTLYYNGEQQNINVKITSWKKNTVVNSTKANNVTILDEEFNIPQLNRSRRIWVYTPPNYETSNISYPVLYMQDGQNLFDASTSFSGEWEVDESLNMLFDSGDKGVIVVGIDNGGEYRTDEYTPWVNSKYGGGNGDEYVNFILQTLKPHIDSIFRTKPDRLNTAIMGSSLGGLISFYAAIKHQDVFSKVGVLSPSFWFSDSVYTHVKNTGKQYDMSIYILGGEQESDSLIIEIKKMATTLNNAGFKESEVKILTHTDGKHSEWYWKREFTNAYLWLFNK